MKFIRLFPIGVLSLFCLACGVAQAGPRIEHWVTASGSRVYFVENHDLPMVDVQVDFSAGAVFDPPGKSGLAALTQGLLDSGVPGMDETKLSDRLADLGAVLSGGAEMDRASVGLRTLSVSDKRVPAFNILNAVLSHPLFPAKVLEREKVRTVEGLKEALTRPGAIAGKAFWAALYPAHPYGRQATVESIGSLTRADLLDFYRTHYLAQAATVTVVGDLSRDQAEALAEQLTSGLPKSNQTAAKAVIPEPVLSPASEQRITHPAAQAHVMMGLPALKRGDPDYFPLLVGNYSLGGGGFVSRLMKEVREKRGYAYGVQSYFVTMAQAGPFQIGLQTKKDQADAALAVVRDVLAGFLAEGPSEAELTAAKQNLIGSFPLRLDSNRKILDNVAMIGFYGLPLDYLDRYAENIEKVRIEDIKAAFARHVKPENMATIVVGAQ